MLSVNRMSDNMENKTNTLGAGTCTTKRWPGTRRHAQRLGEHRRVPLTYIKRDLGGHKHTFHFHPLSASGFTDGFLLLSQPLASPRSTAHAKNTHSSKNIGASWEISPHFPHPQVHIIDFLNTSYSIVCCCCPHQMFSMTF